MGLLEWFTGGGAPREDARLQLWRQAWIAAVAAGEVGRVARLTGQLNALGLTDEEVEIEREMLDGLHRLDLLTEAVHGAGLPEIETGHRVVGTDRCHFSAPASMPDEATQPSGRLLLTSQRAIFLGGPTGTTVAWHAVNQAIQQDRDILLVRADREGLYRLRCNTFGDALCGAFLAQRLTHPGSKS